MRELTQRELAEIKKIELDILIDVDRVCRQEKINYSLAFGTLLGAVRHKGFIPWDDDIDIMMPRKDYEYFLAVAPQKLESKFYIASYKMNKAYAHPFLKVMAKNTTMRELTTDHPDAPRGIWVDVFPIDETPTCEKKRKEQFEKTKRIRKALFCICDYTFGKKGIALFLYRLKKLQYVFTSKEKMIDEFERLAMIHDEKGKSSEYVINLCGMAEYERELFDRRWFEDYVDAEFEKHRFKVIKGWDAFLGKIYGDYMELPPENKRNPHHFISELDFTKYERIKSDVGEGEASAIRT